MASYELVRLLKNKQRYASSLTLMLIDINQDINTN